jgi:hypothetical protein
VLAWLVQEEGADPVFGKAGVHQFVPGLVDLVL